MSPLSKKGSTKGQLQLCGPQNHRLTAAYRSATNKSSSRSQSKPADDSWVANAQRFESKITDQFEYSKGCKMGPEPFKVIIIGGSIAGLTLAHCLEKAGIEYVVLEKRKEISPQEGASVLILPHGGRVLDQLGVFNALEEYIEPLHTAHISYPDGFKHTNRSPQVLADRFGVPMALVERRNLLKVLYELLPNQSRVQVDNEVVSLEHDQSGQVTVKMRDGCVHKGDLVVGADGVHSRIRNEIWRLADEEKPGTITDNEKQSMTVKYACVFGISNAVTGLVAGEQIATLNDGRSFLTFPGKDGRVFWFLMNRLDRKYSYSEVPRWSSEDAKRMAEQYVDDHIWNGVHFRDVWNKREVFGVTNLEENIFQTWHWGRVVCLGDSMHKMAPNTGQGANCAIEDAALLTNYIRNSINKSKNHGKPSNEEINALLERFSQDRVQRLQSIYRLSRVVVRLHARQNLFLRLMGRYYLPNTGDLPADMASKSIAGGVYLDFLPLPRRSGPGWKNFASETKSLLHRVTLISALALPLGLVLWTGRDIRLPPVKSLGLNETYLHS